MRLLTSSTNLIEDLKKINIYRSEDLIEYLPYRYDSFYYTDEDELLDKMRVVVLGKLVSNPRSSSKGKLNTITFHFVSNKGKFYSCIVFNRPYLMGILDLDSEFTIVGTFCLSNHQINVSSLKKGKIDSVNALKPIYHLPSSVSQSTYLNLVKRTFERIDELVGEVIPSYLKDKYHLLSHKEAIKMVHFPLKSEDISKGLRTLKFEECLEYCFKNRIIRQQNKKLVKVVNKEIDTKLINQFILNLEYKLTRDQIIAIREIVLDLKDKSVMYRLLQGDVGTGKTIVGIITLYANYLRGKQGVLLAPTDSLARQHYENVNKELSKYNIKTCLLIGDMKQKEKQEIKSLISEGKIDVIVGTHAVFSESVNYSSLGLAIIDEQHRFGVNQRNMLASKGDDVDLLLMSATPIPRTLALSIYGDLDVSSLTMYPSARREVITKVVDFDSEKILSLLQYGIENNRQVFVVCPKISCGEQKSSEEIYDKFKPLFQEKIALLHGKMPNEVKIEILDKFKKNEISILVSTTIVELGIDIKNACGMIIYSANSFGLSSLHQLRGRVGRDGQKAYCLLVDHFDEEKEGERLKFLETCSNGLEIAEEDMKRRGPGDFIGIQQSGFPSFNSLNIVSDFKMFEVARSEVSYMFTNLLEPSVNKYYYYCINKIKKDEVVTLLD
ncbi:MAG: ATP-dependent DNA helicase RecG [Bacilli bacterium]|nr:ATP-dependent DNA helicase RecG [Bacillales bacterium]MDY2575169.1 ATP-dependent DNA helicase RecG [Bacilli bacterium]